ncbi:MAG: MarR family transcriptional regulator [Dictyoglomus sp.]|nr:MarR family transcriptional regulator [Dictyoglomus sp.]MCX7941507.1 MarR family transcriptional regulator [Dictyoglomaceae bacterium]MDW8188856.1 MarR family transcriptional regulator [Dictyoglomus sp.]
MKEDKNNSLYSLFKEVIKEHFIRREKLLSGIKLYRGQAPVLLLLQEKEGLIQKDIVRELKIKPSTVTLILRRMERRGLIRKEKDKEDKRYSRIYLTNEGKKFISNLREVFNILEKECFMNFSEDEKELLKNFLKRIRDNLRKLNENSGGSKKCAGC